MSSRATGPIDFEDDSGATILRKAGEGAIRYALRNSGWTEEQIENAMASHYRAVAHELAEEAREFMGPVSLPNGHREPEPVARYVLGWHSALNRIDPPEETP